MAGICTNVVRDSGGDCEHLTLTALLDGESITIPTGIKDGRWSQPLDAEEKKLLLQLLARWWKGKGHNLAAFAGRVLAGEEATNVRVNNFFGPGAAITMTNMRGAATQVYANCLPGFGGEPIVVNFDGVTEVRIDLSAQFVAAGPWQVRIIRDSNSEVFYESPSLTQTGERSPNTGWMPKPAGFDGEVILRSQMRSVTATDDPVLRRLTLFTR